MQAAQFVPGPIQTGMDGNPVLQRQAKRPVSIQVEMDSGSKSALFKTKFSSGMSEGCFCNKRMVDQERSG